MDVHYLGEFSSISDAWKMYPNGGGFGDYITVNGVRIDWSEYTNTWGEPDPGTPPSPPPTVVDGDLNVTGTGSFDKITTGDYDPGVSGALIDESGNGEFRTVKIDSLLIKNTSGKLVPLSEYIKIFKTELPPDWEEYTKTPLFDDIRLLVFDANSNNKYYTTIVDLKTLINGSGGGGGGEVNIQLLRSDDTESIPTDNNVFTALRVLLEIRDRAISKKNPDAAEGLIRFLAGAEFGEFISGMFAGKGARIDNLGNMEATSLILRSLLEVPELRFNRLTVIGDEVILTENGMILSVEHIEGNLFKVTMKLEEGEAIAFLEGDLIKGIFHHENGFATSFMRVEEVGQTFMKVMLANDEDVPTPYNAPPKDFMKLARIGYAGEDHPERQRYIVISSKLGGIQVFDGCTTFLNGTLVGSMDIAQSFKSLYGDLPLKPGLFYLYAAGLVVQDIIRVDYQGVPIRTINDKGPWRSGEEYYNNDEKGTDDVWHLGCRWRCFSHSTTDEPSWTSASWYMIEGRSDARMEFDSSVGYAFVRGSVETDITPVVFIGNTNVSADIVEEQWNWTRESGNPTADDIWNVEHSGVRVLQLRNEDMGVNWSRENPVRFQCEATYPASSINTISNYIEI